MGMVEVKKSYIPKTSILEQSLENAQNMAAAKILERGQITTANQIRERNTMKITPVKGRPMLHWVGKRPIDTVSAYPAQVVETYNVENPEREPTYDKFKDGPNLLFHGDNKEILSTLLVQGFRGKIDLIYIDPPFDSGADYVRKVKLRGKKEDLEAEGHSVIEQTQYTDIWANDNYLQFMFERLILMRELLSDKGSLYLHCDWHKSHHLRLLLDEVFGEDNFVNDIVWWYKDPSGGTTRSFRRKHDILLFYAKTSSYFFNVDEVRVPYSEGTLKQAESGTISFGNVVKVNPLGKLPDDVFEIPIINSQAKERTDYPTQKPEALVERIIKASSKESDIVLDCFAGSGTTAGVAEKLGRRWIAADLNKGAIQTTMKRVQTSIDKPRGITHYRVNNYDFQTEHELKRIVVSKYGVETDRKAAFFDGTLNGTLVKIVDLTKPLTRLDIQFIKDELQNLPDEMRNITVLCNGSEIGIQEELDTENQRRPINKIIVQDIQRDGVTTYSPAGAEVNFKREGQNVTITIVDYISPTILARLEIDRTELFDVYIDDFRAQIDCILIDTDYTGEHFTIVESDMPEKKEDFVEGEYTVSLPRLNARVAVKIIDMLGEETIITE